VVATIFQLRHPRPRVFLKRPATGPKSRAPPDCTFHGWRGGRPIEKRERLADDFMGDELLRAICVRGGRGSYPGTL